MSYINNNIRWSIQLCDEAFAQYEELIERDPVEAATLASVLSELNNEPNLGALLITDGAKTENYKIAYVKTYVLNHGVYIFRLSINAECSELFTSMNIRLLYYADQKTKVFKVLEIMPRSKNYGDDDPNYQQTIVERYQKYSGN